MVKLYYFRKKIGFNPIYLDYFFFDSTGTGGIFWVILVFFLGYFGIFLGYFAIFWY
jgi:hypothetical protein